MRALRSHEYLYIRNFKPERWPAGAPVKYDETGTLSPGYHDIDDFMESYLFENRSIDTIKYYFDFAVAKRPAEEMYDILRDPYCLNNLATLPEYQEILIEFRKKLKLRLIGTGDPRLTGNGDIWESYERFNVMRSFPVPDWATDTTYGQH